VTDDKLHLVAVNWRDIKDPDAGGAEIHLHEILTRMAARGHRVTFFSCRFAGASEEESYDGIDVIRHGKWYDANFTLPRRVKRFLEGEKADLVLEDINKIPFYMPWYTDVPVMPVIPHLFGATVFRETNPLFASYVYLWELMIPHVYRRCRFAVISESTKEDLVRRGVDRDRIDVVLCGLDHGRFRLVDGVEKFAEPTLVHFGRVRKYKAIDVVIRALKKIRQSVPNARLVVIGDGPELPNLRQLADQLGLAGAVEFTGRVSTEAMVATLNRAHLFLNASPKEGWGLTVVEANACGVPVIGSNRPGLRDSILHEKTGYLVEYGDVDAFAARSVELLTDDATWQRMRTEGLSWAGSMTWDRCADEMGQLFMRGAGR